MKRQAFIAAIAVCVLSVALTLAVRAAEYNSAGTWLCTVSGEGAKGDQAGHFTLVITEDGDNITGSYYHGTASLTGARSGNTVTGTFNEKGDAEHSAGSGVFKFVLSDDGQSFTGSWGPAAGQTGGTWNGTRQ